MPIINNYFDEWGGLHRYSDKPSDNSILFLAYLDSLGVKVKVPNSILYEKESGLFHRTPDRPLDTNSWDEYLGWVYLSKGAALRIATYGIINKWYYDNVGNQPFSTSYWRQPSQQYVILKAAGLPTNIIQLIWFYVAMLYTSTLRLKHTSEILMQRLSNKVIGENLLTRLFESIIDVRLNWREVWHTYFTEYDVVEYNHPVLKALDK